jgi:hypothetical protein
MIDILGLLRAVLFADSPDRPKGRTLEYAERLKREAEERKKHIAELVNRYERDRAIRRANDN